MDFDKLGLILKSVREAHHVTQAEMAKYCGLSTNYVSAMERGVNKPSAKTLILYAQKCGLSIDEMIDPSKDQPIIPELNQILSSMSEEDQKKLTRILHIVEE